MKHIKLFEAFGSNTGLSAVGVFLETRMAVGVFPTPEAESIFQKLRRSIPRDVDYIDVEIVEVPEGHDLVIVPLGGKGISTSTEKEMESYGDPVHDIVELGKDYDFGNGEQQMAFRVNPDVDGFVLVDSAGGTHLMSPSQMEKHVY
jgi:hypothetical protein